MIIGTIVDGIVIDHIPAGKGMDLYKDLGLDKLECEVAVIKNADSAKYGKKDILKVNEVIDLNYDMLGYIDPHITVNIIRGGERMEKLHPTLPETITGVIRCKNPRCITSIEQELPHIFRLTDREREVLSLMVTTEDENQKMANDLDISRRTLQRHIAHVYEKAGVQSRIGLYKVVVAYAAAQRG